MKEPMQRIVEAAGECAHREANLGRDFDGWADWYCNKCGASLYQVQWEEGEPVPYEPVELTSTLDELSRLAAKIGIQSIRINLTLESNGGDHYVSDITADTGWTANVNYTPAEALLNALDQDIQEGKR